MGLLDSMSPELRAWNKLPVEQQALTPKPGSTPATPISTLATPTPINTSVTPATSVTNVTPVNTWMPVTYTQPMVNNNTAQYDFTKTPQQNQNNGINVNTNSSGGTIIGGTQPISSWANPISTPIVNSGNINDGYSLNPQYDANVKTTTSGGTGDSPTTNLQHNLSGFTQDQIRSLIDAEREKKLGTSSTNQSYLANAKPLLSTTNTTPSIPIVNSGNINDGYSLNPKYDTPIATPDIIDDPYKKLYEEKQAQFDADTLRLQEMLAEANKKLGEFQGNQESINKLISDFQTQGQEYKTQIADLIKSITPFKYDENTDPMLAQAIKYADRTMMEELNKRGILSSTITGDNMANIRAELMPKYQNLALENYNNSINQKLQMAEFMNRINSQDLEQYVQFATASINQLEKIDDRTIKSIESTIDTISKQITNVETQRKNYAEEQAKLVTNALAKLDKLGYADAEISKILGIPIGTPSAEATKTALNIKYQYDKAKLDSNTEIEKTKITTNAAKEKAREDQKAKQEIEDRKVVAGELRSQLSAFSGADALANINANYKQYSDLVGSELSDIVKESIARRDKDESEALAQERFEFGEKQANIRNERLANAQSQSTKNMTIDEKIESGKTLSTSELKQLYNSSVQAFRENSYDDAYSALTNESNKKELIGTFGLDGYKKLYNDVLADVFKYNESAEEQKIESQWKHIKPFDLKK